MESETFAKCIRRVIKRRIEQPRPLQQITALGKYEEILEDHSIRSVINELHPKKQPVSNTCHQKEMKDIKVIKENKEDKKKSEMKDIKETKEIKEIKEQKKTKKTKSQKKEKKQMKDKKKKEKKESKMKDIFQKIFLPWKWHKSSQK